MANNSTLLLAISLATAGQLGCSDTSINTPSTADVDAAPTATSAGNPARQQPADPIAASAHVFLDALFAGDTARADGRLTPIAAQQLAISGQRFAPPGGGLSDFRVGEVRKLDENHAAVECVVVGQLNGQPAEERFGCLLRKIAGDWRVSGVVFEIAPDEPPTIINFEQPAAPAPSSAAQTANQGGAATFR